VRENPAVRIFIHKLIGFTKNNLHLIKHDSDYSYRFDERISSVESKTPKKI
jgi:hypothetical protein